MYKIAAIPNKTNPKCPNPPNNNNIDAVGHAEGSNETLDFRFCLFPIVL